MNLQRMPASDEKQWSVLERALSLELGGLDMNPSLAFLSLWDPGIYHLSDSQISYL